MANNRYASMPAGQTLKARFAATSHSVALSSIKIQK